MISVITPSVRPEGLKIVEKALKRQTMQEFEWLVGSPDNPNLSCRWIPDMFELGFWTVNRIYNKLIKEAKYDCIVSWQDYTSAHPDALEKFWYYFKTRPDNIVSGVGNKYTDDTWSVMTWKDPRERSDQGMYYPCYFNDIEGNFCMIPKKALYEVGGFDEELDMKGYGMDIYGVMDRLNDKGGWDFRLDQTNKSFSLEHDRLPDWEIDNLIHGGYERRKAALKAQGEWPVLPYLKLQTSF